MIDHMMVPLDGSELAERALPCAERLAAATGAEVHLVRVVEPVWAAPLAAAQMTAAGAGVAWPAVYTPDPGGEEAWAAATQAADEYLATQHERLAMSTGVPCMPTGWWATPPQHCSTTSGPPAST